MTNKNTRSLWGATLLGGLLSASTAFAATIQVTAPIAGAETWVRTNEYVLNKFIYVLAGGSLTIEPGTVVKGAPGKDAETAALIVTAGGKLFANGTPTQPIIFTAAADDVADPDDLGIFDRGLWGGVVLLGKSVLNTATDAAGNAATPKYEIFEGLPDAQVNGQFVHRFGGSDDDDSSGVLRYVSIRHAGTVFQPNKELNGLSLGAVGRGTTVEFVEAYAAADDGFEFFGGTVNTKYLVSAFNDDDAFDIDMGFRGKNQFWFALQEPGKKDNGGEWNGEPNGAAANNAPIANWEIYNATWIGAGTNASANAGLTVREYAAPKLFNSILTQFGGVGLRITDDKTLVHVTNGLTQFRENLWFNFATNGVPVPVAGARAAVFFNTASLSNQVVDPQLRGISRAADGLLDPRPAPGSPALAPSSLTPPADGFYSQVNYRGAFAADELWIDGWTFLSQKGFLAPRGANVIQVTAPIAGAETWVRTNEYVLNKFIYVLAGGSLTIEPGTVVKGAPGKDAETAALIVTAGGKLFANGTPTQPIIFTAAADDVADPDDLGIFDRGLWGGVVLLGKSVLNTATDAAGNAATPKYEIFEGLPDAQVNGQFVHRFGGSDDDDSSGVLRYVSIRHAGTVFQPNKELNGLSLGAVGRGTTVEFVEAYAAADDGFEFFGGTVNTKYLVSAFNDDDAFDIDMGFRGKNQFWFALQEPGKKDNGGEWNGEPNGAAANNAPIANWEIYNATWIGAGTNASANAGLTVREYAAPKLFNSILTQFGGVGLRITDDKTLVHVTNGLTQFRENLWFNFATNGVPVPVAGARAAVFFNTASLSNQVVDPQLRGISRAADGLLDPRPAPGSPALAPSSLTPPADGFYSQVNYRGAFGQLNWASDWSFLAAKGVLTATGGGNPTATAVQPTTVAPVVSATLQGGSIQLIFPTQAGRSYQVQTRGALDATAWTDDGAPFVGDGSPATVTRLRELSEAVRAGYYRVVVE